MILTWIYRMILKAGNRWYRFTRTVFFLCVCLELEAKIVCVWRFGDSKISFKGQNSLARKKSSFFFNTAGFCSLNNVNADSFFFFALLIRFVHFLFVRHLAGNESLTDGKKIAIKWEKGEGETSKNGCHFKLLEIFFLKQTPILTRHNFFCCHSFNCFPNSVTSRER